MLASKVITPKRMPGPTHGSAISRSVSFTILFGNAILAQEVAVCVRFWGSAIKVASVP